MLIKTKAIVLRALKYGESKLIVDLLTKEEGRVNCVITVPKTQKGKLKKQFFQPLTILSVELDFRTNRDLQHLRDAHIAKPYVDMPFNASKLSISLFLAEFLFYSTREERQNEVLFAYIEQSLEWLDECRQMFSNFHLVFMMRLTRFIGFFPNTEDYQTGDFFDLRGGCFTSSAPLHTEFLPPKDAALVNTLMRMDFGSMHLFKMSHTDRNRIVDVIATYYRLHVPSFPELKSLAVLKEMWA